MSVFEDSLFKYLKEYHSVSFPEIGSFMLKSDRVQIHPVSHHFQAPKEYWHFNPYLLKKDRAFLQWLTEESPVPNPEHSYDKYAKRIKSNIEKKGSFKVINIGEIKFESGKWLFTAEDAPNDDFFGLPEFELKTIAEPVKTVQKEAVKTEKEEAQPLSVAKDPEEKKEISQPKTDYKRYWAAAILVAMISLGILMALDISFGPLQADKVKVYSLFEKWFGNEEEATLEPILTANTENIEPGVYIAPKVELSKSPDYEVKPVKNQSTETPAQETNSATKSGFYLILGSFKDESNAQELKSTLLNEGVSAEVFSGPNGYFRTGYFLSSDKEEAVDILRTAQTANPNLWILEY